MEPKRDENGSQNRTKIGKRRKKGGPENDAKNEAKTDGVHKPTLGLRRVGFGAPGGLGGTVKSDLIQM